MALKSWSGVTTEEKETTLPRSKEPMPPADPTDTITSAPHFIALSIERAEAKAIPTPDTEV